MNPQKRRTKLLIHLGMGGHTSQILRLVDLMETNNNNNNNNNNEGDNKIHNRYEYIIGKDDQTSARKIKYSGKIYRITNPRLMKDKFLPKVVFKMIPTTIEAFLILYKSNPKAIISSGPSQAIPLFWLAKMMGIKTIFVESWVRVHHRSQAGKLVYPVSDLFLVQWESMKKVYPKAVYAGRLS